MTALKGSVQGAIAMNIFSQLRRDEGVRLRPYTDTVGKLTIGVGRNLTDRGITEKEADRMLSQDVLEALNGITAKAGIPYDTYWQTNPRYCVLVNMAFNMGVGGLLTFRRMLAAYKAGDWDTAAKEMLDSKWATQVGARAHRLSEQMRTGVWK